MLIDPIALDAEEPGYVGRIDEPRSALSVSARPHKLGDPLGDLLDVIGI